MHAILFFRVPHQKGTLQGKCAETLHVARLQTGGRLGSPGEGVLGGSQQRVPLFPTHLSQQLHMQWRCWAVGEKPALLLAKARSEKRDPLSINHRTVQPHSPSPSPPHQRRISTQVVLPGASSPRGTLVSERERGREWTGLRVCGLSFNDRQHPQEDGVRHYERPGCYSQRHLSTRKGTHEVGAAFLPIRSQSSEELGMGRPHDQAARGSLPTAEQGWTWEQGSKGDPKSKPAKSLWTRRLKASPALQGLPDCLSLPRRSLLLSLSLS